MDAEFSKITFNYKPQEMLERADTQNFWYKYEDECIDYYKGKINYDLQTFF